MTQRARSPVLGYNHNLRHGGRVFHVQTEDSGTGYARVYTHLFFEGTILSSKKQQYDPASSEDSVRGMMQQLHKAMIRELSHGGHDPHIAAFFASRGEPARLDGVAPAAAAPAPAAAAPAPAAPAPQPAAVAPAPVAAPALPPAPDMDAAMEAAGVDVHIETPAAESGTPAPSVAAEAPAAAPRVPGRAPAPRPKPVVVVKPSGLKRPPVVLSSSADGVVVRRNVVINVGAGAPPVNGSEPTPAPRPRLGPPVPVRDVTPAPRVVAPPPPPAAARLPDAPPQPLASSQNVHMPWETPAPKIVTAVQPAAAAPAASDSPARTSRQIRMPWDPPAPAGSTDAFASDLVNDKSLDEVILEYLSDDAEPEGQH